MEVKRRSRAPGHGACSKSVSRVIIMQDFILAAIIATEKCTLFLDLTQNFDSQRSVKCRSRAPGHGVCLKRVSRTTTMQGFILAAITAAEKYTSI